MNIVLASKFNWDQNDLSIISNEGMDNTFLCPDEAAEIPLKYNEVDVVIGNWFFKYHEVREFTRLKYIQLLSSGYNGIDPNEIKNSDVIINTAKNIYSIPISEYVVGNILSFYKCHNFFYNNQRQHKWEKKRNIQELYGKKVLIVGTGSIGIEIAKRISAFTNELYGCNRTKRDIKYFNTIFPLEQIDNVINDIDVIILSIALTQETEQLITSRTFDNMKSDCIIVNVSRGGVINESDLNHALKARKIGGAILDVFEEEPLEEHSPLWNYDNVIITPHNAFASDKNNERLRKLIIENFVRWRDTQL